MELQKISPIQKDLTFAGLTSIHRVFEKRKTMIFHVILPTAPDWFASQMQELLDKSNDQGRGEIIILGKYPAVIDDYSGKILNDHKGAHYTPEFNHYWAGKIMEQLLQHNIVMQTR